MEFIYGISIVLHTVEGKKYCEFFYKNKQHCGKMFDIQCFKTKLENNFLKEKTHIPWTVSNDIQFRLFRKSKS